jgi:hypothetical protein
MAKLWYLTIQSFCFICQRKKENENFIQRTLVNDYCCFDLLGRFAWSELVCCSNAEYRWAFLRLRFLAGDAS